MANVMSWLAANWMQVLVSVLAIDAALIPLFPDSGLLKKVQSVLGSLVPKDKQPPQ